jgi:hypothetical protein
MNQLELKKLDQFLSERIRSHLKENYYNKINLQETWDEILQNILTNKYPIQENIEKFAETGIINLDRSSVYILDNLDSFWKLFIGDLAQQPLFVKHYLCLILYMGNISPIPMLLENSNNLLIYFKPDFYETLVAMQNELAEPIKELLQKLGNNSTTILLELILLAQLKKSSSTFPELIQNKQLLKTIMLEKIDSLIKEHASEIIPLSVYYNNVQDQAFAWLATHSETAATVDSILYTLAIYNASKNIYYAAGTRKEFGYYQRLLDSQSANAVYVIPHLENMYLLKGNLALFAGVTNIKKIENLENGDLIISFRKSQFLSREIMDRAVLNVALVIVEYLQDYFQLSACNPKHNSYQPLLLLESSGDEFSQLIIEQLRYLSMDFYKVAFVAPALSIISDIEKNNYLKAKKLSDSKDSGDTIINLLISNGYEFPWVMTSRAFKDARIIDLQPGDILCEENTLAAFIYIPFSKGLKGKSIKSDIEFYPHAFVPVGQVAVIENWHRTATIVAEKPVRVLMIRSEIYLAYWKVDYTEDEFIDHLKDNN